jgi:copper chaperone CopZ
MTQVDVVYRYHKNPTEQAALGIARLREVYGIRQVHLNELEKTIRVEYDSTRLTEQIVAQLLRRAGLDLTEKVVLYTPPAPPAEAAPAA